LSIVFKNNGCSIRTAETAEEGLRVLNLERFDVIISDLRLPGIVCQKYGIKFAYH